MSRTSRQFVFMDSPFKSDGPFLKAESFAVLDGGIGWPCRGLG